MDHKDLSLEQKEAIRKTPLFVYHGERDGVLPCKQAKITYDYLKNEIYSGEFKKNFKFIEECAMKH